MKNIRKNSIKLSLMIVFMIVLLIAGIIAIMNPTKYISFIYRNGLIISVVGVISIIISIVFIYLFGRKLINNNSVFSIDSEGISDKVNVLDYPFINWNDIIKIEECNISNVPHLKVLIRNPKQYINQKESFKKWVLNFNYKKYQTPILLNSTFLKCSFFEFKQSIRQSYEEYKKDKIEQLE
jgi:hypothetical protein